MAIGFGTTYGVGSTDVVEVPYSTHPSTFSIACWLNRAGRGGGNFGRVFDKNSSGTESLLMYGATDTYFEFIQKHSSNQGVWAFDNTMGTTYHVVVTYDNSSTSNNPIAYVDGSSVTVTERFTPSGTPITTGDNWHFGNRTSSANRAWDGWLAECAIFDRILTASEAAGLAKGYSPLFYNPKVYCPFVAAETHDYINGAAVTVTGTAYQTHPEVISPSPVFVPVPPPPGRLLWGKLTDSKLRGRLV